MTNVNTEAYNLFFKLRQNYGENFLQEMDANGDGTTVKHEFTSFMEDAYGSEVSNDTLNRMWTLMDTNKKGYIGDSKIKNYNALDEVEMAAAYKNIELLYGKVQEVIEGLDWTKINIQDEQLKAAFLSDIQEAIYSAGANATEESDLDSIDIDAIVSNLVQEYEKQQNIENYITDFNSSIVEQSNYQALVSQFPEAQDEIDALVEGYITSNYDDLANGNTTVSELVQTFDNDVVANKLAVLKAEIAVIDFINSSDFYEKVLKQMGLCTTVNISELFGKKLGNGLDLSTKADLLTKQVASSDGLAVPSSKEFVTSDSKYLLEYIKTNASTTQAIEDILNDVKANVEDFINTDGTINESKIIEYVADKFLERIDEIFGAGDLKPEDAYKIYTEQVNKLNGDTSISATQRLIGIQKAADNYINSLIASGYSDIVNQYMQGQTFTEMNAKTSTINTILKQINEAIKTADTAAEDGETTSTITGIEDFNLMAGATKNIDLDYSGTGTDCQFVISAKYGQITGNAQAISGKFTYVAPDTECHDDITINVIDGNGQVVATKEVNVTVRNDAVDKSEIAETINDTIGSGFIELYHQGDRDTTFSNGLNAIVSRLGNAKNALIELGLSETKVNTAYTSAVSYYTSFLNAMKADISNLWGENEDRTVTFTYTYVDGSNQTVQNSYKGTYGNMHSDTAVGTFDGTAASGLYYFDPSGYSGSEDDECIYVRLEMVSNLFKTFVNKVLTL